MSVKVSKHSGHRSRKHFDTASGMSVRLPVKIRPQCCEVSILDVFAITIFIIPVFIDVEICPARCSQPFQLSAKLHCPLLSKSRHGLDFREQQQSYPTSFQFGRRDISNECLLKKTIFTNCSIPEIVSEIILFGSYNSDVGQISLGFATNSKTVQRFV